MQVAQQFKRAGAETESMMHSLESSVNELMIEWEGTSAQRFFQEYQQWVNNIKQVHQLLDGVGQQLTMAAETYRQADHY